MAGRHRKPVTPGRHRKPPSPARWVAPGLVAVALLGAGGVGAHAALTHNDSTGPGVPVADRGPGPMQSTATVPTPTPTSAAPSPTQTATAPAEVQTRPRAPAALAMSITRGVSWIEVARPSGRVLVSGLVRDGRHLRFRHGPLRVVIGNAGAVRLVRHGHVHAPAGRSGQVLRFTVH